MSRLQTIVVAIDFSETSHDALDAALHLASDSSARVHLLHVAPDPFHQPWVVEAPGVDLVEVQQTWVDEAKRQLAELAARPDLQSRRVASAVVVGSAAAEIVRYASEQAADVIVLGSHGHGLVRRFLLGGVADRVIRQAGCPVMVVPHRTLRAAEEGTEAATTAAP